MFWTVLGIVAGLIAVDLLIHVIFALIALPLFERTPPFGVELVEPDPQAIPVTIPTKNGQALRGSMHYRGNHAPRGLIVFCPELGGNHWSARFYAAGLIDAGFHVLSVDFRSQGESDSIPGYHPIHWLTEFEVDDVLTVIDYAHRNEQFRGLPFGLFGISRGGAASLAAAARCQDLQWVACEGAFTTEGLLLHYALRWASLYIPTWLLRLIPTWHVATTLMFVRWFSQIRRHCRYTELSRLLPRLKNRRVLFIAGERDTYVLPELTETLCRSIGKGCDRVWVVRGAKHNMARQVNPQEYDRTLVEFFSHMVAPPPAGPVGHGMT